MPRFFNCFLFSAGFWALIRPWRPFRDRILQTILVDTGTWLRPDLVELCCSWKGAGLGFSNQQTVLPSSCLAGSAGPGLVKNISSLFKSFSYSLYLTLRHIEGVNHLSSGSWASCTKTCVDFLLKHGVRSNQNERTKISGCINVWACMNPSTFLLYIPINVELSADVWVPDSSLSTPILKYVNHI